MKTKLFKRALKRPGVATSALLFTASAPLSQAGIMTVNILEDGSGNVRVSYAGSLDVPKDASSFDKSAGSFFVPQTGNFQFIEKTGPVKFFDFDFDASDLNYGGGFLIPFDSTDPDNDVFALLSGDFGVAGDYQSGDLIEGSALVALTFEMLLIKEGTYTATDSENTLTINVGPVTAVPEVSGASLLAGLFALTAFARRRR